MSKYIPFSDDERVFLSLAIDCLVDKISCAMWELDSSSPFDRPLFEYLDELRFRIDTMKGKIDD